MRSTPRPGRGNLLHAVARRPAVPSLRFCRIPNARQTASRDYRDSRAVLDTQWSFLRCVLMGLAAERRKNVAPAEARGFVSVLNPAPEGRKTRPRIFRPFRGSASPDQGTPGARPVTYTHFVVAERGLKLSPLLGEGGVAAPYKKMSRSHLSGRRRGGSFKRNCFGV